MAEQKTARDAALSALLQMEQNNGYSNLVLDKALESTPLSPRDAALTSTLFYGVLERKLTLDWLIAHALNDPKRKLDPTVQMALRLGTYQIFYMDRIPDSAAVNETVDAVKRTKKRALAGFVNGVLRSLLRKRDELTLPAGDSLDDLSVRYSVPVGLIGIWRKAYGIDVTKQLLESFHGRAEIDIRVNSLRTTVSQLAETLSARGITLTPAEHLPFGGSLSGCGSPVTLPEFQAGLFHVQDFSAQLTCEIVSAQPGETVIDCCAAPGGKSFTLAQAVGETGHVYSFDLYEGRVGLIEKGAQRLGLSNVTARAADMTAPPADLPKADRVLCDVPCSGFGVIRRKPEIRYKDLDEAKELPPLQYEILHRAAELVKPGGKLVYSTCTLNHRENGKIAEKFLAEHPEFTPCEINLAGISRVIDEPAHHLTMMPFSGASDGFFAAAFMKKDQ